MSTKKHESASGYLSRRRLLQGAAGAAAVAAAGLCDRAPAAEEKKTPAGKVVTKGRIRQSVCAWCFQPMTLETLAQNVAAMGLNSIELVDPKDWPILKKHGLICAIASSSTVYCS